MPYMSKHYFYPYLLHPFSLVILILLIYPYHSLIHISHGILSCLQLSPRLGVDANRSEDEVVSLTASSCVKSSV